MDKITTLFIAIALFAIANGGVQEATPEIVREALNLFRTHCANGASEAQIDGSTTVYCKIGAKTKSEESKYDITVTPAPNAAKQIVFVQTPPIKYNHVLTLRGGPADAQQTRIFVLPPKVEHQYEPQDQREATRQANKPTLYFLSQQPSLLDPRSDVTSGGSIHDVNQPYRNPMTIPSGIQDIVGPGPTYLPPRNQNYYVPPPQAAFRG